MILLFSLCAIFLIVFGVAYVQSEANKQKIINLSLDEIDAMEGHQFEHYTAAMLQFDGFEQVQVTQASGDYGVDVIAYKGGHKWAFQCKRYSKNLGLKPIQEVYAGAKRYGADKAVVFTNVYFTPNAQSLANTLHVELWGRDKLADMIWRRKQEEENQKEFRKSVMHGNRKKKEPKQQPVTIEKPVKEFVAVEELPKAQGQDIEQPKLKESTNQKQLVVIEPESRQEPRLESKLMQILYPVKSQELEKHKEEKIEVKDMATIIGAGKYTFGLNIPMGCYDLKVISGEGQFKFQTSEKDEYGQCNIDWMDMGKSRNAADAYKGLTLPEGWFFSLEDSLKCEITKSKMLEIE
nr:MAG TPA: Restriction endonuclease [Caudoviricetes sp.]